MINITSLGGSGEDSRNCFLVQNGNQSVLLDCGVRREIADAGVVYPALTREIAVSLDAVIISHAHEDHTAALPYLYELGYRGFVYASKETIGMIPSYLSKWVEYVKQHGGSLPFDKNNIGKIRYKPVDELPFPVRYGRDGHIIGGLWYLFDFDRKTLLYTGDLTYDSLLLEADPLPEADILIIDSAYAGKHLVQKDQYEKLYEHAHSVLEQQGKLLLPVPANGRGIDMFLYLSRFSLPLYAEENIVRNTADLFRQEKWVKLGGQLSGDFVSVNNYNRKDVLRKDCSGVYIFGDGMMTSAVSAEYFAAVRDDRRSRIIISGHSAKGTLANDLLSRDFVREQNIRVPAERLTIKVHNDEQDVLDLVDKVRPEHVMLFHSRKAACETLVRTLNNKGIGTVCEVLRTLNI